MIYAIATVFALLGVLVGGKLEHRFNNLFS